MSAKLLAIWNHRQNVYYLGWNTSKGEHHGPRADKGSSVQQVWSLCKARVEPTHKIVGNRACKLRWREMGQTQEDSQPRIPSGEIKGLLSTVADLHRVDLELLLDKLCM